MSGSNKLNDSSKPECFSWSNVSYIVKKRGKEKKLISDMYGSVRAGQVIAILGASGAGKSTLLNTLAGRIGPGTLGGEILIDGKPRNPSDWRLICSYVEQDDVMFPNFTVFETLMFTAMLRLPSSVSLAEKKSRVEAVIAELGLRACRDTRIGTPEKKGISGGERKRLSVGLELVTNPSLIFLDEPTSGLDSFNALNVIHQLRKLATEQDKMIILTIHQPRYDILDVFDKVLLLAEGRPVWFGSIDGAISHFDRLGYHLPPRSNPADFLLDTASVDNRKKALRAESLERISSFWDAYERVRVQENHGGEMTSPSLSQEQVQWSNSIFSETKTLLKRYFVDFSRDRGALVTTGGQLAFTIIFSCALFNGLPTTQDGATRRKVLFTLICLVQFFGNAMPYVSTFPMQRMIIKRERGAGSYRASSSFFSKFLSIIPVTAATTFLVSLVTYWVVKLNTSALRYAMFIVILLIGNWNANAFGLAVSACSPSIRISQIVTVLFGLGFLYMALLPEMSNDPPIAMYFSPITYTYSAFVLNELDDTSYQFEFVSYNSTLKRLEPQMINGHDLLERMRYSGPALYFSMATNVVFTLFFLAIGCIAFSQTSKPLMKLR